MHTAQTLRSAFKYLFLEELTELQRLAQSLPPDPTVVNIGAGAGTSGLAFCESRADLRLVTVDVQAEASPFGCLVAERQVLEDAGYWGPRVQQVHGDSKDIGRGWRSRTGAERVDMVFIDGDHSYEGCRGDIEAWMPNLKPGGLLAIHDYRKVEVYAGHTDWPDAPHPTPWPGVDRAVDDLLTGRYERVSRVRSLVTFRIG